MFHFFQTDLDGDKNGGFLERIRRLIGTPTGADWEDPALTPSGGEYDHDLQVIEDDTNTSPDTEVILEGDRPWEKLVPSL